MRDLHHFIELFGEADTVGDQTLAEAVYAARHGDADEAEPNDLRPLIREMPESTLANEARARIIMEAAKEADPIPYPVFRVAHEAIGSWGKLGDRIGVERQTVWGWSRHDDDPSHRDCAGISAKAVRSELIDILSGHLDISC